MKKAGKILSYLLVLTLVVSLMSGLGFENEEVKAGDASNFYVLEIVPDTSMGTFGLLLGRRTLLDVKEGTQANWGRSDVRTFVKKFDYTLNTSDGSYTYDKPSGAEGDSYFESLLKSEGIDKAVHLDTVTPSDSQMATLLSRADLIVINQTVPSCFKGITRKTFDDSGCGFSNEVLMKVFKKIAGIGDISVPYIIDFSMYYPNGSSSGPLEIATYDHPLKASNAAAGLIRGVFDAQSMDKIGKGSNNNSQYYSFYLNKNTLFFRGSSRNSYKLLKLLSSIDPATFYGLFFRENDGSYGFDEDLRQIFMTVSSGDDLVAFNLNKKADSWLEPSIGPFYLFNIDGQAKLGQPGDAISLNNNDIIKKMGWFWPSSITLDQNNGYVNSLTESITRKIGSGENGNGMIFYSSNNGIFKVLNSTDDSTIGSILNSYYNSGTRKVDNHPYRYLVVVDGDEVDGNVNRSVIADMVKYANDNNTGLAGGIIVDCMSANQFANINVNLNDTYDGICVEDTDSIPSGSVGKQKYTNYSGTKINFTRNDLINAFKSDFNSQIEINYIETPQEYVNEFYVGFLNENQGQYSPGEISKANITNNNTFINSTNSNYRKLKFDFIVSGNGGTSFDVYLLVDVDNNGKFDGEYITSSGSVSTDAVKLGTVSNGGRFSKEIPLDNILGKEYAGGFSWKLVVKGGSGMRAVSRVGYSALKPNTAEPTTIRILQIHPTDYYNDYTSNEATDMDLDNTTTMSHPSLLLPRNNEKPTNNVLALTSYDSVSTCLNDKMEYSVAGDKTKIGSIYKMSSVNEVKLKVGMSAYSKNGVAGSNGTQRNCMVYNSSLLYYYLNALKSYNIETTRYSVSQFNSIFGGKLNGDESEEPGKEIFYDKTENRFYNYESGTKSYFDLLMLGFGTSMDYMDGNAVSVIEHYISNNGSTLVGFGTVSRSANNTLGKAIMDDIGMSATTSEGYDIGHISPAEDSTYMVTNDTILTHYPYRSNHFLKGASGGVGPFKLDLSDDELIVTYTKFNSDVTSGNLRKWGYAANNYYLYRIKNTTYCGFGKTYANATPDNDQLGVTMTPAEIQIVVNAIINAARIKQSGIVDDPYIDCIDPDRSVIVKKEKQPIKEGEPEPADNYYVLWDSVYTDYDSLGMAKIVAGKNVIVGSASSDGLISSTSSDGTYRIIPYKYRTVISGGAKLVFSFDEAGNNKINEIKVNDSAVTDGSYDMGNAGTYNLYVPLSSSTSGLGFSLTNSSSDDQFEFYLSLRDSEDKILEVHKIIMVRRVLYPVN